MTGTWRDTLFVWQGKLARSKIIPEPVERGYTYVWWGSWVGCEDCPDAATAPTPNESAFAESGMEFEVGGAISTTEDEGKTRFRKLDLTQGSGWDLGGEGAEKKRYQDQKHTMYWKESPGVKDHEDESGFTLQQVVVVAVGENEFGSFVSAGYQQEKDEESCLSIILGRRYLDEGDERARWSVEELYKRIVATDHGTTYFSSSSRRGEEGKYRIPPWRTPHLHAKKQRIATRRTKKGKQGAAKRKRGDDDDNKDTKEIGDDKTKLPPLNIPPVQAFSPHFEIGNDGSIKHNKHLKWVEQCHGCGKELDDPSATWFLNVDMQKKKNTFGQEGGDQEPSTLYSSLSAYYCTTECACQNGAPAWTKASSKNTCFYESWYSSRFDSFWDVVDNDEQTIKLFKDVGWTKQYGEEGYILQPGSDAG